MKKINETDYKNKVSDNEKSPFLKNMIWAFVIGGLICVLGQGITDFYLFLGIDKEISASLTSVTLIFLSGLFTGLGLYEKLATYAGAGTLVPITGFANAVVSPSIEFKNEGFIFGVGAKMFVVAGPVIVYGVLTSFLGGILYYIFSLVM